MIEDKDCMDLGKHTSKLHVVKFYSDLKQIIAQICNEDDENIKNAISCLEQSFSEFQKGIDKEI